MELAELVRERVRRKTGHCDSEIVFIPYEKAYRQPGYQDMACRIPDISRIRRLIGWEPQRNLGEIIDRVIDYHLAQIPGATVRLAELVGST